MPIELYNEKLICVSVKILSQAGLPLDSWNVKSKNGMNNNNVVETRHAEG